MKICVLLLRTYIGMPWAVSVRMYACGHLKPLKQSMGLFWVWKPEHQKKLAENLAVQDKQGGYSERPLYLREEACLTDAPNYIAAVL